MWLKFQFNSSSQRFIFSDTLMKHLAIPVFAISITHFLVYFSCLPLIATYKRFKDLYHHFRIVCNICLLELLLSKLSHRVYLFFCSKSLCPQRQTYDELRKYSVTVCIYGQNCLQQWTEPGFSGVHRYLTWICFAKLILV